MCLCDVFRALINSPVCCFVAFKKGFPEVCFDSVFSFVMGYVFHFGEIAHKRVHYYCCCCCCCCCLTLSNTTEHISLFVTARVVRLLQFQPLSKIHRQHTKLNVCLCLQKTDTDPTDSSVNSASAWFVPTSLLDPQFLALFMGIRSERYRAPKIELESHRQLSVVRRSHWLSKSVTIIVIIHYIGQIIDSLSHSITRS